MVSEPVSMVSEPVSMVSILFPWFWGTFIRLGFCWDRGLGLDFSKEVIPDSIHFIKHDDIFCNILMKDSHSNITLKAHLF